MLYPLKVIHSMHNLFAGIETLSLSVYEPIAMRFVGDRPPFGRGGWAGVGQVWYPVKVIHIRHNLFAGNETLSLSVYETIAMCVLWGRPQFGEKGWS